MTTNYDYYKSRIEACLRCASACSNCASLSLQEADVQKRRLSIQLSIECAALCNSTAQLMSLGSIKARQVAQICAQLCEVCSTECATHEAAHCRECARLCTACAQECRQLEMQPALA